ncbi:hypothetical protein OSB04_013255 [Centaurea solstitialis]|uniref:Probable glutathione S-transferase n=1 Tax=Centaurea solstitialis TaxID=347529 RepID=A0AA38TNJ5_9ASTR|nr:hypothetical protein OSB04_013255 [Centaurea solstitialis]
MGEVKLLSNWSSPIALRIIWALKHKAIDYETINEDLQNKSCLLLKSNPIHKKVPVLLHNGTPICESLVILEYIDEIWSTSPRILPEDPLARANARFWAKFGDEQVIPPFYHCIMSQGKDQEAAKEKATENLKLVEEHLKGKQFFGGKTYGFLDFAFGWLAYYPRIIKKAINLEMLEEEKFPNLCAWNERFRDIPVIKENWPDEDAVILMFQAIRQSHGI